MVKVVEDGGGRSGATSTILHQLPPSPTTCSLSHRRPRAVNHPLLLECGLSRGETGDRHAERRAGHVIQAHVVTELHRRRLAAVLSTDADLELGPRSPAELDRQLDRSEEHTSELQSQSNLVCRLLLEKKKTKFQRKAFGFLVAS